MHKYACVLLQYDKSILISETASGKLVTYFGLSQLDITHPKLQGSLQIFSQAICY
jgi:hypothetical protein